MNEHREEKVEREREYRVITVRRLKSIVDRRHTGIVACVIPYTEYIDATTKAGRHIEYYRCNRVRGGGVMSLCVTPLLSFLSHFLHHIQHTVLLTIFSPYRLSIE